MSQRNPQNARYQSEGGKKNVTRKSSGRAKPKSAAASSVYVPSRDSDKKSGGFLNSMSGGGKSAKEQEQEKKDRQKAKLDRKDTRVVMALSDMPNYKKYRTRWIVLIVLAIVGVVVSFGAPRVMCEGGALEALASASYPVQAAGLVVGYGGLIAALIVDFKCMRPIRKQYNAMARGGSAQGERKESKKERQHREEREAIEAAKKANKKPLFGRKKKD